MIGRYRSNSTVVEAMQFDGSMASRARLAEFAADHVFVPATDEPRLYGLAGTQLLYKGWWVVRVAPDAFLAYYDEVFHKCFTPESEPVTAPEGLKTVTLADEPQQGDPGDENDAKPGPHSAFPRELHPGPTREQIEAANAFAKAVHADRVVGMDLGRPGGDHSAFVIPADHPNHDVIAQLASDPDPLFVFTEEHPHAKLVQGIMALTGSGTIARDQPYEIALVAMKQGYRVTRARWNGRAWLCAGEGQSIGPTDFWNKHTRKFAEKRWDELSDKVPTAEIKQALTRVDAYIIGVMVEEGRVQMGYCPGQDDQFATDWIILEN